MNQMRQRGIEADFIVTTTTRARRVYEIDGVNYSFVSEEVFKQMISGGELLEHANVYGNWYGVPRTTVRKALDQGRDAIIKVDIQGAVTIKHNMPEACFVFVTPPDINDLSSRLKKRNTESESDLELRLKTAGSELDRLHLFDYVVYNRNGFLGQAVDDMLAIIRAEKIRVNPRRCRC